MATSNHPDFDAATPINKPKISLLARRRSPRASSSLGWPRFPTPDLKANGSRALRTPSAQTAGDPGSRGLPALLRRRVLRAPSLRLRARSGTHGASALPAAGPGRLTGCSARFPDTPALATRQGNRFRLGAFGCPFRYVAPASVPPHPVYALARVMHPATASTSVRRAERRQQQNHRQ